MLILKIAIAALTMILGLGAGLSGALYLAAAPAPDTLLGSLAAGLGLAVGVVSLIKIVRWNREYQDQHLAAVLQNPAEILARWPRGGGKPGEEVILAERGLFVGRAFHPFDGGYQSLTRAELRGDALTLTFASIAPPPNDRREVQVPVPGAAREAVAAFVAGRAPR